MLIQNMFHRNLKNDLESDFSDEISEQNSKRNFGNYRNSTTNSQRKPKKLILISEEELQRQNYKLSYDQNNREKVAIPTNFSDSNYQTFPQNYPNYSQQNYPNEEKNGYIYKNQNTSQNTNPSNQNSTNFSSENKFNKKSGRKSRHGAIILTILILACLGFGGFWFWQNELAKSRIVNKNCLENLEQNKNLELDLSCQKVDESVQSLWKNANLENNFRQNQSKIESEKQNLQNQISQIDFKISQNLNTIDKFKIINSIPKPNFVTNSTNSATNQITNQITNSSVNSPTNSSFSQNSSQSTAKLTQNSDSQNSNQSNQISSILFSNSLFSSVFSQNNSSFSSTSNFLQDSQKDSQNSQIQNSSNLKLELAQKNLYYQSLENLLKTNLDQKIDILDKIIGENGDLEKELDLGSLQVFVTSLKSETGIIGSSNTDIVLPQKEIDWSDKFDQVEIKIKEVNEKIETEIAKNPDKNRQRLIKIYKTFSGEEFKNLYNSISYEKTLNNLDQIPILGDKDADDYIRKMAQKRGYQKRAQADETKLEEIDGQKLQTEAKEALLKMQKIAKKEGLEMVLVSAYRSNQEQQQIFIQRLGNLATIESIKDGKSDVVLDKLLQTTSIPGYSRHHTGYTIDLGCNSTELTVFKDTKCYEWLSRDNYLNSKRFGFIPSYPKNAGLQGPDPEEWEYVWIPDNLLKN